MSICSHEEVHSQFFFLKKGKKRIVAAVAAVGQEKNEHRTR